MILGGIHGRRTVAAPRGERQRGTALSLAAGLAAVAIAVASVIPATANAQRTARVDAPFTDPVVDGNYLTNGEAWQTMSSLPELFGGEGNLPFAINFGQAGPTESHFCVNSFQSTIGFGATCDLSTPYLAPLFPAKGIFQSFWDFDSSLDQVSQPGSVTYSTGRLAADPTQIPPNPNDAPRAVRFHWNEVHCSAFFFACNSAAVVSFQAILIDASKNNSFGDFDLEFNYSGANSAFDQFAAELNLPNNFFLFDGTEIRSGKSFDFQFRNGVGSLVDGGGGGGGGGTVPVPEPGTIALLLAGFGIASLARRRKLAAVAH